MKCDDKLGGKNKPCGWTWVHLWRQNGGQFLPLIKIRHSKFSFAFMHLGVVNILFRPNTITQSQNTIKSSFQILVLIDLTHREHKTKFYFWPNLTENS